MSNIVKKRAFRHDECEKSQCPIRRARLKEIAKLEGDIALLTTFNIPAPKATSKLNILKHFQAICNDGKCHE
jgi:hypothetical protein